MGFYTVGEMILFKVATWNVNSLRVRLPHVLQWLDSEQPDVLALQETKVEDKNFPLEALAETGYHATYAGQKTYNGVAILSKQPVASVLTDIEGLDDPQRRILAVTVAGVRILNLYVPNGSSVDSDKYQYKLSWLQQMTQHIQHEQAQHDRMIVLGDFNIAPADVDVHDPAAWEGQVLVSDKERDALQGILAAGFVDSFRQFEQAEASYSWWDYRAAGFRRNRGLRIDLVLSSAALAEQCVECSIDKQPRALERPSDHAPVFAVYDHEN